MYVKFLKDVLNKKRTFDDLDSIAFTEHYSAVIQNRAPPKKKDIGSFSIPYTIVPICIHNALCEVGASVSVLPLSLCKKLKMRKIKCTTMTLQMADHSIKHPLGILEDVPIRVGKFFIPVDFVVLDMAEDLKIPITLGRPFLCTVREVIDLRAGSSTLNI
ncbi:uncharacterized protein LOC104883245 [Beta vulgaris subsp. vulgaris]|uniref:uncharacterized protein LOC104883245 n=1 Tax=Beta vulgaris subsp. vulgaris TaxID=3555 RepID=UPI002036B37F|nr:uncharacterized protein LOC104883245 [Beta vulgaris subsp. vulgaris]